MAQLKWQAKGAVTAGKYQQNTPGAAEPAIRRPRRDECIDVCLNCIKEKCRGGEKCRMLQKAMAERKK